MPISRLWLKTDDEFLFVAEMEVYIDEEGIGHSIYEEEQLLILNERIFDVVKEGRDGGKED